MTFAAFKQAIERTRTVSAFDDIGRAIWQAHHGGHLDDQEAQSLAETLHAARNGQGASRTGEAVQLGRSSIFPARRSQRRPERSELIERRRRLAFSGPMPPALALRFTVSELAVLSVVAGEVARTGSCALPVDAIAALSGTSRRTVQNAIALARSTGLLRVVERRRQGQRNLPNLITILSREWTAWVAKTRRIGCRNSGPMSTKGINREAVAPVERSKRAAELEGRTSGPRILRC